MISLISPINNILKLNTRLFLNVLDGINDETAHKRLNKNINNISFIALHVLHSRYYLSKVLGIRTNFPFPEVDEINSVNEMKTFPSIENIKSHWQEISLILLDHMPQVSKVELEGISNQSFPIDDNTIYGSITFLVEHEAYHIGQLGLLRKYFGLDAMRYT